MPGLVAFADPVNEGRQKEKGVRPVRIAFVFREMEADPPHVAPGRIQLAKPLLERQFRRFKLPLRPFGQFAMEAFQKFAVQVLAPRQRRTVEKLGFDLFPVRQRRRKGIAPLPRRRAAQAHRIIPRQPPEKAA